MSRRLPYTPNSKIRQTIRQLWLRSRERAAALKAAGYACERCGVKQSVSKGKEQKIEVHHREGIEWDGVLAFIRDRVLQTPVKLECLCPPCHKAHHQESE